MSSFPSHIKAQTTPKPVAAEAPAAKRLPGPPPGTVSTKYCTSHEVPRGLDWVTSGVWRGEEIIFADALSQSLKTFKPGQKRILQVQVSISGDLSEIRRIPDGSGDYLVEDEAGRDGDRLIRVDSQMNPISTLAIQGRELGNGAVLDVIYDWQPVAVDGVLGVLAFGDFRHKTGWSSGLLFFDERGEAQVFREWQTSLDFVFQNTQESGYIAVVGRNGFMLVWEPEPYLLRIELASESFRRETQRLNVPADLRSRTIVRNHPDWKLTVRPAEQMMLHFELVGNHSGTASIFALDSKLFLLSRVINEIGVQWHVSMLNTIDGTEVARMALPVSEKTHHLTIAINDRSVAFLEKGAVENMAAEGWVAPYLPIRNLLILPRTWIGRRDLPSTCR